MKDEQKRPRRTQVRKILLATAVAAAFLSPGRAAEKKAKTQNKLARPKL